ncbi:hypothetical protein [Streptosporangium amethystogenes]|uniref:hypothetical protein n=1 Tax=Streptosporangium amethystogenes TaxID=2002 RepID=UPI0012F7A37C|nr:hypothetical protein [Streptosporangium amethystogenes]
MHNLNAPVLERTTASGCGCFADSPPLPMGCAACGHAPYAHGCPGQSSDHDYAQPSAVLMAERLEVRRRLDLGRTLPTFEPAREITAQPTPVPRQADPEAAPSRTRPAGRTDARRPTPGGIPSRVTETRQDRAVRLALARDPLSLRRARLAAHTVAHTSAPTHERGAPPPSQEPLTLRRAHTAAHTATPTHERGAPPPSISQKPTTRPPLTPLPDPPEQQHQTLRPGSPAPGRSHSPDAFPPRRHDPYRQQPHRWETAA